jgi:hypothetical protein
MMLLSRVHPELQRQLTTSIVASSDRSYIMFFPEPLDLRFEEINGGMEKIQWLIADFKKKRSDLEVGAFWLDPAEDDKNLIQGFWLAHNPKLKK